MSPPQWVTHPLAGIPNCTSRERELSSSIYCSPLPYCGCHMTSFFRLPPPWLPAVTDCICRLWARISLFFLKLLFWRPFITAAGKEMKSAGLRSRNFVLHNCNSPGSWASNDGLMSGTKGKEEAPKPAGYPTKTVNTWSPDSNNLYPLLSLPQGQQRLPDLWTKEYLLQIYNALASLEVRGQFLGAIFHHMGSRGLTEFIKVGSKSLYSLGHFTGSKESFSMGIPGSHLFIGIPRMHHQCNLTLSWMNTASCSRTYCVGGMTWGTQEQIHMSRWRKYLKWSNLPCHMLLGLLLYRQ